jgi:hypothetical protein
VEIRDYWAAEERELSASFWPASRYAARSDIAARLPAAQYPDRRFASHKRHHLPLTCSICYETLCRYFGAYVFTTMPLLYATDFTSDNGVRCENTLNPFPIAIGLMKKFSSTISRFSFSDDTRYAPPYTTMSLPG